MQLLGYLKETNLHCSFSEKDKDLMTKNSHISIKQSYANYFQRLDTAFMKLDVNLLVERKSLTLIHSATKINIKCKGYWLKNQM